MGSSDATLSLTVYIITFILGFPTNLLAFFTFLRKVRRKPMPIDILLLNLTVSDLLFLIFLPFKMQEVVSHMAWNLPEFLCPLSGFVFYMTIYSSIFFLTAISVERYLGVAYPIQHVLRRRPVYAVAASIFFWTFSALNLSIVCIIPFIHSSNSSIFISSFSLNRWAGDTKVQNNACYENFTQAQLDVLLPVRLELCLFLFLVPFLISCFCYISFIRILSKLHNIDRRRRLRAIALALVTLLVFTLCFVPYNVSHVVGFITWKNPSWRDRTLLLSTFNACLDPFIFYLSSSTLRGAVRDVMKRLVVRLHRSVSCHVLSGGASDKEHKQETEDTV